MSDRARAVYFVPAMVAFLAVLVFALRPSLVLGVDGKALSDSVTSPSWITEEGNRY